MGLTNFNELIANKAPNATKTRYLSEFSGKRIAIDGSNFSHIHMSIAQKQYITKINVLRDEINHDDIRTIFLGFLLDALQKFLICGVTPVIVLDGEAIPEKAVTRNKRKEERDKRKEKLTNLENSIDRLREMGSDPTPSMIKELEKYYRGMQHVNTEDYDSIKNILVGLGIPFLQAKHDAEKLCSNLCSQGYVSAVYSRDCDNYAFGCPRLITNLESPIRIGDRMDIKITIVDTTEILTGLGFTLSQLVDMFIVIGCDYGHIPKDENEDNNKRKGKITGLPGIAIKKGYDLISKYRSIENIPSNHDTSKLNYVRCREIFSYEDVRDIFISEEDDGSFPSLDINTDMITVYGRDVLSQYNLDKFLTTYLMLINTLPPSTGDEPCIPTMKPKLNIIRPNTTTSNNTTFNTTTSSNTTFNINSIPQRPNNTISTPNFRIMSSSSQNNTVKSNTIKLNIVNSSPNINTPTFDINCNKSRFNILN